MVFCIMTMNNRRLYRNVVFSRSPLKGLFRYKDIFQIYPCYFSKAPKFQYATNQPLVMEYYIEENNSENSNINPLANALTQINKINRLCQLMTAITNHRIHNSQPAEVLWGKTFPGYENRNHKSENHGYSTPIVGIYSYPGLDDDLDITQFSNPEFPMPMKIPHKNYYFTNPIDSFDKEILLPETIYRILDKYFALDYETRKIIDSVCLLICNGIEIKERMKSLSFLSFVSSIETLLNFEYRELNNQIKYKCNECKSLQKSGFSCKTCGDPTWAISFKFKEFLENYVSKSSSSRKKFDKIYSIRSKIIHSGALLLGDGIFDLSESKKTKCISLLKFLNTKQ
jgi:hypothetical protein